MLKSIINEGSLKDILKDKHKYLTLGALGLGALGLGSGAASLMKDDLSDEHVNQVKSFAKATGKTAKFLVPASLMGFGAHALKKTEEVKPRGKTPEEVSQDEPDYNIKVKGNKY